METILLSIIAVGVWLIAYAVVKNSFGFAYGLDEMLVQRPPTWAEQHPEDGT